MHETLLNSLLLAFRVGGHAALACNPPALPCAKAEARWLVWPVVLGQLGVQAAYTAGAMLP